MESLGIWYQNWAEACSYAQECVPDVSFTFLGEPYSALGSLAGILSVVWWRNEKKLQKLLLAESHRASQEDTSTMRRNELAVTVDQLRTTPVARESEAA